MPRLSVSLSEEQTAWIEDKAAELDVSKGKVVRECIDDVRTGDSLFTTSVNETASDIDNRVTALESRLEQLEARLQAESHHAARGSGEEADTNQQHSGAGGTVDDSQAQSDTPSDQQAAADADAESRPVVATDSPSDTTASVAPSSDQSEHVARPTPRKAAGGDEQGDSSTEPADRATPDEDRSEQPAPDGPTSDTTESGQAESPSPDSEAEGEAPPRRKQLDKSAPETIRSYLAAEYADERASAVFACWELLQERGTAHVRAFKGLHEVYPLDHETDDEWWTEAVKPILESLPGVSPPEPGGSFYRFKY